MAKKVSANCKYADCIFICRRLYSNCSGGSGILLYPLDVSLNILFTCCVMYSKCVTPYYTLLVYEEMTMTITLWSLIWKQPLYGVASSDTVHFVPCDQMSFLYFLDLHFGWPPIYHTEAKWVCGDIFGGTKEAFLVRIFHVFLCTWSNWVSALEVVAR